LLLRFIERNYELLSQEEIIAFSELIECSHDELNLWMLDDVVPADDRYEKMVDRIKRDYEVGPCD